MASVDVPLDAVWALFHVVPDGATPDVAQSHLREILHDPTLELVWWDWENERYVDADWQVHELAEEPGRVVTMVDYESRRVGALVHDPKLLDVPGLFEAFVPAIRIAMERDRLRRELVEKIDQVQASRHRIVAAADEERRRLERNLHDGAQQSLIVVLLTLRGLEARVGAADSELAPLLARAREELEGAIEELRELARGLHPPLLAQRGLAAAIRAGVARSSLPIELDLDLDVPCELPASVEAAAYYVCAEAITNAVKHAQATRAWIRLACASDMLEVEVRDDGIGGATLDRGGTGLPGLVDRVEALDGTLVVDSPPGAGTSLRARFPV